MGTFTPTTRFIFTRLFTSPPIGLLAEQPVAKMYIIISNTFCVIMTYYTSEICPPQKLFWYPSQDSSTSVTCKYTGTLKGKLPNT